ncbi:hypothetical protein GSI_07118 [Ganoderma sinense ZZ0214-1]|uniref:Spc7 kinetochore protein domain-containing protein n=1 Tax=Ganoderma sinense ZZ0214-1 TaxID=1077348 RepID=A0A2G8SB11_9APHY|nr:hypothetical protein GSI_07118 [Ganoderma sinense ZZ0214-1]
MDMTEVHGGPRKSLVNRRVSFAAHTHVRLFHIQSPDSASPEESSPAGSSPADPPAPAFITRAENDENALPGRRRSSIRRRSSGVYSEFGERSMDMDLDDTAPLPQDFLPQREDALNGSAVEDDEFSEDEDESDMEVTEAIALNIERKRSLSLGGNRASLAGPGRRRSSVVTVTQHQSENQPPPPQEVGETSAIQEEGEGESFADDVTTSSAHTGSSYMTEGSSGEPMEFTIPVLQSMRQPKEPDPVWLQLRAMTHAGSEPYEPPPPESDDDALLIQPSPGASNYGPSRHNESEAMDEDDDGEMDMDLTSAMTRLQKARASYGIPPSPGGGPVVEEDSFSEQEMRDDTFSTEDSFGNNSMDLDNHTINVTQRISLGTTEESSMDETDIHDGVVKVPITPSSGPAHPKALPVLSTSHPAPPPAPAPVPAPAPEPLPNSVFSAPTPGGSLSNSVFSAPPPSGLSSSVFSAPPPVTTSKPPADRSRSPAKSPGPATVPKPFTFSVPRASSPSKTAAPTKTPAQPPVQPHRGTAAFAPPSVPKSPKRPASALETPGVSSSAQQAEVGRLDASRKAAFEAPALEEGPQPPMGSAANRRASTTLRRPSGYFAQRKSLGAGVLPPNPNTARAGSPEKVSGGAGLSKPRASVGAQPSGAGLGLSLARTQSDLGPRQDGGGALYPDLSELAQEAQQQRAASPVSLPASAADKGKGKECEREAVRQSIAVPSPTRGSPAPLARAGSPALPQRVASPIMGSPAMQQRAASPATEPPAGPLRAASPANVFAPRPAVTHIGQPQRVVDVSMAMDIEPPTPNGTGVSQAWRESVPEEPQDEDGPTISIEQFFQMTGIRFMDELTMPRPRRSTVGPGQLRPRPRRRSSAPEELTTSGMEEDPIPLSEFAIAMAVDMPRIDLYTAVARDLTAYIQECKKIYREAEAEALKDTPSLFREFASVDESEQAMLIHQLKLIKANNIGAAKSQWYDWKQQWVEQLYESASQGFAHLEQDATYLAGVIKEAQDRLPELRKEYEEVTRLLEQEQADIDEIENSDQDYLNELKASIAEQSNEIEAFRADVSEAKAKLERLDEKLAEIESQKEEVNTAITQARHIAHIQKESTSVEVFRLKAELEALEDLHLWHATKLSPDLVEFIYASKYHVSIPCTRYTPVCSHVQVRKTEQTKMQEKDSFPHFTELVVKTAHKIVTESQEKLSLKQVVERLSDFWSSCAQFRSQLTFLAIKYPLSVEGIFDDDGEEYLSATATVMFPKAKGKARISFLLDQDTYSRWPLSVRGLKSHVEVAYGSIQRDAILSAVLNRLSQVTPADSHGCLLDACIEATEQYE